MMKKLMLLTADLGSEGQQIVTNLENTYNQISAIAQAILWIVVAIVVMACIGFPLIFGGEEGKATAKRRVVPMLIGIGCVVLASYIALYAISIFTIA